MKPRVSLSDLVDALDWADAGGYPESLAYVCRRTGRIYWTTEDDEAVEPVPEDIEDAAAYAQVPAKAELDLGSRLVFRFVGDRMCGDYDRVRQIFSSRGAYARFKALLVSRGLLDAWHAYEQAQVEAAVMDWARSEGFDVAVGDTGS